MGKKSKIGKARRDKFYNLAKETGYRSRASFKLLQLNRKHGFLDNAKVLIDLCAAPGSWLQVAQKHMPVSSLIVGVDLVPIKPIHNVTTFQEDITTEKCRQRLKQELQTWKADVVLNDGAPNVGKTWVHDAYAQATLTLEALKLAISFLRRGGWFVTKVFRSKDYTALLWVLKQLFRQVHATKPQASRNESAEIFIVCQNFLAPEKIDPKFMDPKHVFKEIDTESKVRLNLMHPEKQNRQREGYEEGNYGLYKEVSVIDYLSSTDHLTLLATVNKIVLDEDVAQHKLTTDEIKECCKDIRVLGKTEIKLLIRWRAELRQHLGIKDDDVKTKSKSEEQADDGDGDVDDDEKKLRELEKQLEAVRNEEKKDAKKKLKRLRRERSKLQRKIDMKMVLPGDKLDLDEDPEMFSLKPIKGKELEAVRSANVSEADAVISDDDELSDDDFALLNKKRLQAFDRHSQDTKVQDELEGYSSEEEEDKDPEDLAADESEDDDGDLKEAPKHSNKAESDGNALIVDLQDKSSRMQNNAKLWFSKDAFKDIEDEADEDYEIERKISAYKRRGGVVLGQMEETESLETLPPQKKRRKKPESDDEVVEQLDEDGLSGDVGDSTPDSSLEKSDEDISDYDSDESSDSDYDFHTAARSLTDEKILKEREQRTKVKGGIEIVPQEDIPRLDPIGLAIGKEMIKSKKRKRDIMDAGYNKYMFSDENLPEWFTVDEKKHCRPTPIVSKEQIDEQKARFQALNSRPIHKVAEAKARKKKKALKKIEKAREKADAVVGDGDVDAEKWKQIKDIYKKAGVDKKQKRSLTYVVAKKGAGKKVSRPAGVKGQFKVVDGRMKKDLRGEKRASRKKGGKSRSRRR